MRAIELAPDRVDLHRELRQYAHELVRQHERYRIQPAAGTIGLMDMQGQLVHAGRIMEHEGEQICAVGSAALASFESA
jgi:hypothetical protein